MWKGGHAEADGIIQIFEGSGRFPGCVPLLAQRFQSVVIGQIRGAHGCLQKESWASTGRAAVPVPATVPYFASAGISLSGMVSPISR